MSDETPVGIDLGTTFSCVGIWRNNQVEIIANSEGQRTTPSYVSYKQNDEILIGQPAQRQLSLNPSNTIYDMKRLIGNKNALESIKRNGKYWTFKVNENSEVEVNMDNQTKRIKPEEVSAQILIKLKQSAENVVRKPIKNIVLTVPAYFDENQKAATTKAAELAGLNVLDMISEPSAAAYAYGFDQQKFSDTNLLVFDLGGGTLDVVIVKIKDGIFNVVGIGGDTQLGGRDFDNALMDHFVDIIEKKYKKKIAENVKAMQRLLRQCIDLKHMITSTEEANLYLGELFPGIDEDIKMDRATFDKLCFPLFHRIEMIILGTLKEADMSADKIEEIILVGGSSRMPEIKELLLKIFPNKKLNFGLNPDEAIAYGATLRATQISKKGKTNIILNETNAKRLKNTSSMHTYNPVENNVYDTKVRATHMAKKEIPIKLNVSNAKHLQNTTKNGSISLISAVKNNNINMVRLLLENGENPNVVGTNNQIALHLAASDRSDKTELVELLLKHGADTEIQDKDGSTSLMIASFSNKISIVRYLLEHGADPNRKDNESKTALHNAASNRNDNTLIVELLLKHGADIEIQDKYGWTSLIIAASSQKINIVRYLLEQGADPNRKDNEGKTALHHAASNLNDNTLIVELLLKHGADIEIQDKDGWTSLMRAVSNQNINIVRYLLKQGADPDKINTNGKTALHIIRSSYKPKKEIIDLLSKYVKKR